GRGIIAGGVVRPMCELAGIRDINAKIISRSTNKVNNAKAVLKAFTTLRTEVK
ncbi:MAG: 30S ribosomal protein S5, partial [Candidatus Portnoybacteria bacterium CG10_big_fil_rev_8_21_14_0_10_36_7]